MTDEKQVENVENQPVTPDVKPAAEVEEPAAPIMIPKDRFDEVNERMKAAETALKALESEREKAAAKEAQERGEFEALWKAEQERVAELEARLKANEISMLRRDVGQEVGIPAPLIDRLVGETRDELLADARQLSESLPKRSAAPNIDSGAGTERQNGEVDFEISPEMKALINIR